MSNIDGHQNGFLPIKHAALGAVAWNLRVCSCGALMDFRAEQCRDCFLIERRAGEEKFCTGCRRTLEIGRFYRRGDGGVVSRCKSCVADQQKKRKRSPKEIANVVEWRARRLRDDPVFRVGFMLRGFIYNSIKKQRGVKAHKTTNLLGCTVVEFKMRIEALWLPGMSWANWGRDRGCWQLDHRRPVSSFDLCDPVQQRQCFHYSNYQPLWGDENRRKGAKWAGAACAT